MQNSLYIKLKEHFGFTSFRNQQEVIIQSILSGKDTLAIMPTGAGKSICYQLPAMMQEGLTLVISPLIALMEDQVSHLNKKGIAAAYFNSSQNFEAKAKIRDLLLADEIKLLYLAPESLLLPGMVNLLQKKMISLIAVDEAHCISQWGQEFRKDYRKLSVLKELFPNTPIIALTATANKDVRKDICKQLDLERPQIFISSFRRENIAYTVELKQNEKQQLLNFLQSQESDSTGIIYCLSRDKVEKIAEFLKEHHYHAIAYHAGLSNKIRMQRQKVFERSSTVIVVATIAFGMGIDRPDVRFVCHLDLPKNLECYYQETGRAGRDQNPAIAWMVYHYGDLLKLKKMIESSYSAANYKRNAIDKLYQMFNYSQSEQCRQIEILQYFEEKTDVVCGVCDNCLQPTEPWDISVPSQKIMSAIIRTGERFGANHLIEILLGSKNKKVLEFEHQNLSVYGIGKELDKTQWLQVVSHLISQNFIVVDEAFQNLNLTSSSQSLLWGKEKLIVNKKIRALIPESKISVSKKQTLSKPMEIVAPRNVSSKDISLSEELRNLRSRLAKKNRLKVFMVLSNATIDEIVLHKPKNKTEMLSIKGIGETKFDKYGKEILNVINGH